MHLVGDVRCFGVLDCFCAFPYETFIGKVRKIIRTSNQPLAQLSRRLSEGFYPKLSLEKNNRNLSQGIDGFKLNRKFQNSCVNCKDGSVMIVKKRESEKFYGCRFTKKNPAFLYPCDSLKLNIGLVNIKKTENVLISRSEVERKCFICKYGKVN